MKRTIVIHRGRVGSLRARFRPGLWALAAAMALFVANAALAQQPDLGRAEQLVKDGKYQEAYDLLAPLEQGNKGDAQFDYLLGRAALGTKRPDQALGLFERSLAARPNNVAAITGRSMTRGW